MLLPATADVRDAGDGCLDDDDVVMSDGGEAGDRLPLELELVVTVTGNE